MASFTVAAAKHATLVASTVDTVTVTRSFSQVRVVNRGAVGALFVRLDGVNPVATADDTFAVPNNQEKLFNPPATEGIQVRVISTGASPYSVEGV